MSRHQLIVAVVAAAVMLAAGAFMLTRSHGDAADKDVTPTATITTAPVRSEALRDIATAYGVVQADGSASATLAAPRAVIVTQVLVRNGEEVRAGQPLIEVAGAPAADLAYRQAVDAAAFAKSDLERVQRLFDARLAAADQLSAAKKALADAEAALAAADRQGGGAGRQTLRAPAAGVVTSLPAAVGDHVAQDAVLLTLARAGAASVKLGLEPSGGPYAAGEPVVLRPTSGAAPIDSRLSMVGKAADPTTKTLDGIVPLNGAALAVGQGVAAEIVTGVHQGRAVPRRAVVFDETGAHVFVVAGGKAQRVFVTAGRDYGDEIEIKGPIAAGQLVAVEGAYELQDGMAVKVAAP
jgi:membrane fusion protein (multidrug efflux system)